MWSGSASASSFVERCVCLHDRARVVVDRRAPANAQTDAKPNILFIMGDDIGWFNIGAYHRGIMAGKTPNLDKLASEGMLFTDYYAEASCTAGRANFITGELPIRTGLTTVGQAGADCRHAGAGADHRHGAEVDGLCHRPVRQEPSRRPQRISADACTASMSSSATSITSTRWRTRSTATTRRISKDKVGPRNLSTPGHRHRRSDGRSALGQGRQAEDHGRRPAAAASDGRHQIRHGDLRRGHPRQDHRVHREGQGRRQAVLRLDEPDAHARVDAPLGKIQGHAERRERLGSKKPAWRRWTTASARC